MYHVQLHASFLQNYRNTAKKLLIGQSIITRYNNKTYKIDDVDFDKSPESDFEKTPGVRITFLSYYKVCSFSLHN